MNIQSSNSLYSQVTSAITLGLLAEGAIYTGIAASASLITGLALHALGYSTPVIALGAGIFLTIGVTILTCSALVALTTFVFLKVIGNIGSAVAEGIADSRSRS